MGPTRSRTDKQCPRQDALGEGGRNESSKDHPRSRPCYQQGGRSTGTSGAPGRTNDSRCGSGRTGLEWRYEFRASGCEPPDRGYDGVCQRSLTPPGHPGGIVVDGHTVYVDTFNEVDRASDDYDAIFTYNLATGALRSDRPNPIKVPRMMSPAIMGLAAMALDAEGRLYVADMNGRIVRVDPKTGAQSDYATFPTNTMTSVSNMPAGLPFDDEGDLYVTDASAPLIWRVPPGGGEAKAWFADPALAGVWGVTGLNAAAIDPSGTYLYFSMQYSSATAVYRLPLNQPEISSLDLVHAYEPPPPTLDTGDPEVQGIFGTSGIAFGASGKLYVVLLGANQVSILPPDGTEALRFPTADQT